MKKFKFKLDGLLRIRRAVEKEVKHELREVQSLCEQQRLSIEETKGKVKEWSEYYDVVLHRGGNSMELSVIDRHLQNLYRYTEQLTIALEVLNRKKEDVARQYQEIRKEVRILEHVKDQKKSEYVAEYLKEEYKDNDEMATLRYVRERSVGV